MVFQDEWLARDQIEVLYQQLGLTDFNAEHINWYYHTWINKLNELKLK